MAYLDVAYVAYVAQPDDHYGSVDPWQSRTLWHHCNISYHEGIHPVEEGTEPADDLSCDRMNIRRKPPNSPAFVEDRCHPSEVQYDKETFHDNLSH